MHCAKLASLAQLEKKNACAICVGLKNVINTICKRLVPFCRLQPHRGLGNHVLESLLLFVIPMTNMALPFLQVLLI